MRSGVIGLRPTTQKLLQTCVLTDFDTSLNSHLPA